MIRYELFKIWATEYFVYLYSTDHDFLTNYLDDLQKNFDIKKIDDKPDLGTIKLSPGDRYDIQSILFFITKMLCNDGWEPFQEQLLGTSFKLKYEK